MPLPDRVSSIFSSYLLPSDGGSGESEDDIEEEGEEGETRRRKRKDKRGWPNVKFSAT